MKKCTYDRNFRSLAHKLLIWPIRCYFFWDTLYTPQEVVTGKNGFEKEIPTYFALHFIRTNESFLNFDLPLSI